MRAGIDLEGIVDRAIALLDRFGLASVTMRALADDLGIRPSALYWHVADKQTLLAAVADRIVAGASPADDVAGAARELRGALLAHRDGAEVVLSSAALGLGGSGAAEHLRRALEEQGAPDAATGANVLAQFVLGHASLVQQRIQAAELGAYEGAPDAVARDFDAEFDAGIAALVRGLAS
ncbi:TetR family transcriptional regulator [Microbacterium halophytorum]|uniref:TetR family transcriptional regulator n=1 Tax=Microbacterium halophytorum TaxID=2067568 RepID=UPI000CFD42A0|nr:TetR/AcrR family transcriptional regulator C-terminal domain-containing protein [Microbacterium halophytorum]